MGEAIEMTARYYPGLLEKNENLMFLLKCRQFIEMVNGTDSEMNSSKSYRNLKESYATAKAKTNSSAIQAATVIHSIKSAPHHKQQKRYANSTKKHHSTTPHITDHTNSYRNTNSKVYKNDHNNHLTDNNYEMDVCDDVQNGNATSNANNLANGDCTNNSFKNGNFLDESDLEDEFTGFFSHLSHIGCSFIWFDIRLYIIF